ncbi:hypothetical protein ANAEL_02491 [Anaerolineales bacterium]|nr:hypothetical protein ANAEL_02491 [Anaerolineales bacterium]
MDRIPNSQLIENDIPGRNASWKKIEPFALTFNGYRHWGSFRKCREVAKEGVRFYRENKEFTQSLTDLRTCLFFESRRWKHYEKSPSKKGMEYVHTLVEAIREHVQAKNLD